MSNVVGIVKENLGVIGAGVAGLGIGSALGFAAGRRTRNKRRKKRRKSYNKSRRKRSRMYRKKKGHRYTPHTAGKRRDSSHRRIRYTRNGQPYVILASGKARFISLKSAKMSHRKTGGRY